MFSAPLFTLGPKPIEYCHCDAAFSSTNKKYRCKRCHVPVCARCVKRAPLTVPILSFRSTQRVCPNCYKIVDKRASQEGIKPEEYLKEHEDNIPSDGLITSHLDENDDDNLIQSNHEEEFKLGDSGPSSADIRRHRIVPILRVVIILVGSHGDVQVNNQLLCFLKILF